MFKRGNNLEGQFSESTDGGMSLNQMEGPLFLCKWDKEEQLGTDASNYSFARKKLRDCLQFSQFTKMLGSVL